MILKLVIKPNKLLNQKLALVNQVDNSILALVEDMKETMIAEKGIGLATNQIGRDVRLFVIDAALASENGIVDTFINPEITYVSKDEDVFEEGCLSLPGIWHNLARAKKIRIRAKTLDGNTIRIKAKGLLARVFQHEVDHLNGILISDK